MAEDKKTKAAEKSYVYTAKDKKGKTIKGEFTAAGEANVRSKLRRQGLTVISIEKQRLGSQKKITEKDIMLFTRQLATMMKSGVPLLQSFDIVGKGHSNPSVTKLLNDIKGDIESGTSMSAAKDQIPI